MCRTLLLICLLGILPVSAQGQLRKWFQKKNEAATQADSTQTDTVKRTVKPDTRWVVPARFFEQDFRLLPLSHKLDFHHWDEVDTLAGFANTLGLVGKPYRHHRFGVADKFMDQQLWRNPLTDQPNVYLLNPETQTRYYDSKTPYVNLDFAQGPQRQGKNITLLGITAAYNVTPFWNMTAYYKRRQSESVYGNNNTDNRLIHLGSYLHDYHQRYQLFATVQYNEFFNQYSGGVFRAFGSNDTTAFIKGGLPTNLNNTLGRWITKQVFVEQYYHLIRSKDSSRLNQSLSFRNLWQYEYTNLDFHAKNLSLTAQQANWIAVLPVLQSDDADELTERAETFRFRVGAEGLYKVRLKDYFDVQVRGGVQYQQLNYVRADSAYRKGQSAFLQQVTGTVAAPKLLDFKYKLNFSTKPNNLFNPESYLENDFSIQLKGLKISANQLLSSRNPSLFQAYYKAGGYNSFQPNPNLKNQQLNLLRAKLQWEMQPKLSKQDTLLANYAYLQPFVSNVSQLIYYNDSMQLFQAQAGENITFIGAEAGGRVRMFGKMYAEGNFCVQRGSPSNSVNPYFQQMAQHLPSFYGKFQFYYQNKAVYKGIFRTGMEVGINTAYLGQGQDPISNEYFAVTNPYTMQLYPRIDLYFATQLKRAYLFAKVINVADGLITPGNYTTPFYPVLPRMLSLGANWSFFD